MLEALRVEIRVRLQADAAGHRVGGEGFARALGERMRRWAKVVARVLIVVVAVPLLFLATVDASAFYYRWRAEKLLAVLKTVRPGVTTEAEYLRLVHPFELDPAYFTIGDKVVPGAVAIADRSDWMENALYFRRGLIEHLQNWHVIPFGADFTVVPSYEDGMVSRLELRVMTPVCCHGMGASVHWSASRYEGSDPWFQGNFSGYELSEEGPDRKPWDFFVTMDERATPEERNRALNLNFRCFTRFSMCDAASMYADPAPNR